MSFIIAISGWMGTGKTTLAHLLLDRLPHFRRLNFADPIKRAVGEELGIDPMELNFDHVKNREVFLTREQAEMFGFIPSPKKDNLHTTIRRILVRFGQTARARDPMHWIRAFDEDVRRLGPSGEKIINDDIRFLNELDYVHARPHFTIRLEPYPGYQEPVGFHDESEHQLDDRHDWDLVCRPELGELEAVADVVARKICVDYGVAVWTGTVSSR